MMLMSGATPSWIYDLFGTLMLVVAGYCLASVAIETSTRRFSGWDVDIAHIAMGISMAGMFVSSWSFGPSGVWELIFGVLLVWFVVRSAQSVQIFGIHLSHWFVHAVMSFAMLMMYVFPGGGSSTGSMSSSMSHTAARLDPGLALLLAFLLLGSAIFTLASPNKGISHHGSHPGGVVLVGADGSATLGGVDDTLATTGGLAVLTTPWVEDLSHVVMCVAMGFMLILMT
jgi:hypothetical protein